MSRSVTANVHFRPDRSMHLVLPGPDGPIDAGATRHSRDLGRMAQEAAAAVYGPGALDVEIRVDRPPWLQEGMVIRPIPAAVDPDEAPTHPYGQIVGFLLIGGVIVVHPDSGAAIYAPEDLVVCDPRSIDPGVLEDIVRRSGIDTPAASTC